MPTPIARAKSIPVKRDTNYYIEMEGEKLILPSVTSILGTAIPKKELIYWAQRETAKAIFERIEDGINMEEALRAPYRKRDIATDKGKRIHSLIESYLKTGSAPVSLLDIDAPFLESARNFLNKEKIKPKIINEFPLVEFTVFNLKYGYAGTCDFASDSIYDWKTGKDLYFDHHLQQIAYLNCTHIVLPNRTIVEMPKFDTAYLVHFRDDGGYSVVEAKADFNDFLTFFEAYKVLKKYGK